MNEAFLLPLCLTSWALTVFKLRVIFQKPSGQKEKYNASLNLWAMLLFFSITLTFMVDDFAAFLNSHTLPNLSFLATHFFFLASQYFAVVTILSGIGASTSQKIIRWIRVALVGIFIVLLAIYIGFLSKMPGLVSESPQNLPAAIYKLLSYPFGIFLCAIVVKSVLAHLPVKEFTLMRLRAITIVWCTSMAGAYIFVRMLIYVGFFWPALLSPWLFMLSQILLFCSIILFFITLLSNKIYTRFVFFSKSVEDWNAFCDLRYLAKRMLLFCPAACSPPNNPVFWVFLFNPEYYLYRAVISILDSKVALAGLLTKKSAQWSSELLEEAIQINQALKTANPSNDFTDIVETYRHISKDLYANQTDGKRNTLMFFLLR